MQYIGSMALKMILISRRIGLVITGKLGRFYISWENIKGADRTKMAWCDILLYAVFHWYTGPVKVLKTVIIEDNCTFSKVLMICFNYV